MTSVAEALTLGVESNALELLGRLGKPSVKDVEWIRADLHHCPSCEDAHRLSLSRVMVSENRGERCENANALRQHLLIGKATADGARALA